VFSREVTARTAKDPRIVALQAELAEADEVRQAQLRLELADLRTAVRSEKLGEVANEFEQVHNIQRALAVGSVHAIIPARQLRPYLIEAVERGLSRSTATVSLPAENGQAARNAPAGQTAGTPVP
jgi:hypothetical protein